MQLIAEKVAVARGSRLVVENASFNVRAGDVLQLTGPNGAGKTTLIRAVAGFLSLAGGSLRLDGGKADTPIAEHCHYVGHLNGVKAKQTVAENLAFWAEYLGGGRADATRIDAALDAFGLTPLTTIAAGYLSAGQKRRVGLARLLVADRPIWLLDEPTVSLDAASTGILAKLIQRHVASGGLVLAATHIPLGLATPQELKLGGAA
ncbi:MAG: heme ABC exporter ATP-binding protein CcmA [Hyphomicrobiaceae bacterium]|nr:heme ABC exporter ATP-binding protein CcmA [Hyphomicrobiaceae bacterium]